MKDATLRLMLVDDHRYFRDGVRGFLAGVTDMTVVGEATNGDEAVARALDLKPDVILMDLNMPGLNGIEATRKIAHALPTTGIIIMTMFEEIDSVLAAMRAGARGYILKSADEEELLRSVRAVANGEALFGSAIAKRLMSYMAEIQPAINAQVFPELTAREREVLAMIAEDKTNSVIADAMSLSLKTVRNHVSSILSKLQVIDRREAMARARAAGLGGKSGD
jgi:DNA-binding NarL/FixJ family response regulator